jgi:hypothetical protein
LKLKLRLRLKLKLNYFPLGFEVLMAVATEGVVVWVVVPCSLEKA